MEQQKKEAAAKAKEEALKRLAERKRQKEENNQAVQSSDHAEDIDMKALNKVVYRDEEKAKAAAAAKAKAAALAKQKAQAGNAVTENEEQPAPNQSQLDEFVKIIEELLGKDVLEEAYINRLSKNVPTIVAKRDYFLKIAECLKYNELLYFNYLSELHGTDFVTHMEVYVYLYSHSRNQKIVLKVKLDREQPVIPSLVPIWQGANWPECEAYDLLGIQFENHPDLKRILLGEEWVGYPLRKDYEPFDVEV